ncbi:G-type lectin S-receptor-like serine/threonine-protein kinase SD1-1 [Gossypium arboreum]|uniref:G-type lectin S-receptor-like serine/threonine-protein kinase SD1-1 n=1 Tax=Gossypium arboreum TaxID=29729 RepID=A0A0B0NSM3_GOSAR|nr:G-type lectin S-receptor-like serine/threonine-protein kinase SD1-1 [Gossypium arboreum]
MAKVKLAIILATVIVVLLGFLLLVYHLRRSRRKLKDEVEDNNLYDGEDEDENEDMDVAVFEFGTIAQATDSFSFMNKLGQGGFGPVYKGTLANGQDIAVKRLSKSSGQGPNEFKNEVKLIAKLQHRNLVRLLGCCIHGDERMLAWRLWKKGKLLDLADGFLVETGDLSKLLRCMHISLFCIQLYPEERPSTASVVLMLGSDNELPLPKELGFLFHKKPFEANSSPGNDGSSSRNEISSSLLEAR